MCGVCSLDTGRPSSLPPAQAEDFLEEKKKRETMRKHDRDMCVCERRKGGIKYGDRELLVFVFT